jgi:hypothetical protein
VAQHRLDQCSVVSGGKTHLIVKFAAIGAHRPENIISCVALYVAVTEEPLFV